MKKRLSLVLGLFVVIITAYYMNLAFAVTVGGSCCSGSLTITNDMPTITYVQSGITDSPTEKTTTNITVIFNVSDTNGISDINQSTATVSLNISGEITRVSSSCVQLSNDSALEMSFNCTVLMYYYDKNGVWTLNASVQDNSEQLVQNKTYNVTYGTLSAAQSGSTAITFGSIALGSTSAATNNPISLDNTGNQNFSTFNVTAYDFVGVTNPSELIGAENFTLNVTADGVGGGTRLKNATSIYINQTFSLPRDISGADSNVSMYYYVKVPSTGLGSQTYTASTNWALEVFI